MPELPTDPLLPSLWYLDSTGSSFATVDINLGDVWTDVSGAGVRVGIYDSAIDTRHPDLAGKTTFVPYPGEPVPTSFDDAHGTATAGIIAAAANGTGTVGIAFDAELFSYQNSGRDWVGRYAQTLPLLKDMDVTIAGYTGPASFDPIMRGFWSEYSAYYETAAAEGRDGLGTVFVIGAGNQRGNDTSSGMQYMQAEYHSIAVGAVRADGYVASYSSQGSNVFITAPSGDSFYDQGIWTTDNVGTDGYNTSSAVDTSADFTPFSGTSASSPMVVGVVALMLEANPDLGWRDVRDILAITARHTGVAIGESATADGGTFMIVPTGRSTARTMSTAVATTFPMITGSGCSTRGLLSASHKAGPGGRPPRQKSLSQGRSRPRRRCRATMISPCEKRSRSAQARSPRR